VLVIAHNDAQNLLATVERIYSALTVTVEEFRIVIFDDGSTDDTAAAAKQACEKYPFVVMHRNNRRMGLGYCMVAGSREASTPYMLLPITLGRCVRSSSCSVTWARPTW
jgi:glycosyltransferase involved in cell wall biosynthesis